MTSHHGHPLEFAPAGATAWTTTIGEATARIEVAEGVLSMSAEAPGDAALARAEDVLGRHLERFGRRQELAVSRSCDA